MRETERHYMQTSNGNPLQDFQEVTTESSDSVELKMTAKGERYYDIKLYFAPGREAEAMDRLTKLDAELSQRFGTPKGEAK